MLNYDTAARISAAHGPKPGLRFETLDSWRGICALLVAIMHFPASGPISESRFTLGSWLFVDYFFVLSGFVIAHGYGQKLDTGAGYQRFLILRFGRIYPLHVTVLLLFVAFEALRWAVPALQGHGDAPFTEGHSPIGFLSNLLLLNGMGVDNGLTWNDPSWSISAEVWTYVLFGAAALFLRRRLRLALVASVIGCGAVLYLYSPDFMNTTWDLGFIRCVYGFALGALLYDSSKARLMDTSPQDTRSMALWTAAELAVVAAIAVFVTLAAGNPISLAAPLLFALALGVFARERGLVSHLLKLRLFLWLGMLSYGIYMVHLFVHARMINGATLMGKIIGADLIGTFHIRGEAFYGFGIHGGWFGTLMLAVMILLVVATAWLGNVLVEKPFQRWSRRLAADPAVPFERQDARFARLGIRPHF